MERLSQLAADPQGVRRGDIYLAIASLFHSQACHLSERERSLMREILQRLTGDVEMAIRIALAERLADDDTAPTDLVLLLADDRIEVARPIILRSRQINDTDLLSLIERASEEHQTACAERPHIGEPICEVLANSNCEPVLVALVRNATARIAAGTFTTLVEKSRHLAALHHPLVHRTDLPVDLATQMCEWISDALRAHIRTSYPTTAPAAEAGLAQVTAAIRNTQTEQPAAEPASGAAKLVEKLAMAGQLRSGILLRALHQGQFDLFEAAFAKLLQMELSEARRVLYEAGAPAVAFACRAVGIDRCVFSTVFNLSRQARGRHPTLTVQERDEIETIFRTCHKNEAVLRLREMAAALA